MTYIIVKSNWQQGFPQLSFTISPYRPEGMQGAHKAALH